MVPVAFIPFLHMGTTKETNLRLPWTGTLRDRDGESATIT
jgi:hypothetical protein